MIKVPNYLFSGYHAVTSSFAGKRAKQCELGRRVEKIRWMISVEISLRLGKLAYFLLLRWRLDQTF